LDCWYDNTGKPHIRPSRELDIDNYPLETNLGDINDDHDKNESEQNNKRRTKARIIRSVCFNKNIDSENYYRELIMLFTSWRNEVTDLIKNYSSHEQHHLHVKNTIDDQMKLHAICNQHMSEIQEQHIPIISLWMKMRKTMT
jgi:hypothetical protein